LHDLVAARELIIEFQNIRPRALEERRLALMEVMWDPESGRRLVRSIPSTDVSIALKAAWHRNGQRAWTVNDIYDIDALAIATPYCDVVVMRHSRAATTADIYMQEIPESVRATVNSINDELRAELSCSS
jgi:hypothetical protein